MCDIAQVQIRRIHSCEVIGFPDPNKFRGAFGCAIRQMAQEIIMVALLRMYGILKCAMIFAGFSQFSSPPVVPILRNPLHGNKTSHRRSALAFKMNVKKITCPSSDDGQFKVMVYLYIHLIYI